MVDLVYKPQPEDGAELLRMIAGGDFAPNARDFRALADSLHGDPALAEDIVFTLCRLEDDRLTHFCESALSCGVAEATDLIEAVLIRRGLTGLLEFVEPLAHDDRHALWLADLLAEVRDDEATRLLLGFLDHTSGSVRSRAAEGLRAHRATVDPRALVRFLVFPLVRGVPRPDPFAAVRALQRLAESSLEPDFGRDCARRAERALINCVVHEKRQAVRGDAIAALGDLGSRAAVRCLVEALNREDQGLHQDVVIALRKIRPERALLALLGLLRSKDPVVREEAAAALGEIGDRQAVRRLRDLLEDDNADVRQEAVLALGKLGGREVLDLFERALSDSDPAVRVAACSALAHSVGDGAEAKLVRALYDDSPGVRAEAAWLLGDLGSEAAQQHLEIWSNDPSRDAFGDRVGAVARRALNRIAFLRRGRSGS
jgi:HEAT repeat protein